MAAAAAASSSSSAAAVAARYTEVFGKKALAASSRQAESVLLKNLQVFATWRSVALVFFSPSLHSLSLLLLLSLFLRLHRLLITFSFFFHHSIRLECPFSAVCVTAHSCKFASFLPAPTPSTLFLCLISMYFQFHSFLPHSNLLLLILFVFWHRLHMKPPKRCRRLMTSANPRTTRSHRSFSLI